MQAIKVLCSLVGGLMLTSAAWAESLEQRVERIERQAARISPLTLDMQTLKRENQHLRGQIEEQQHAIDSLQRKLQDMYLDLDQRIAGDAAPAKSSVVVPDSALAPIVAPVPAADPALAVDTTVEPVAPAVVVAADPVAEKAAYDAAYALLSSKDRQYDKAIKAFDKFLRDYPQSEFAANAMYWKAEASYVMGDNVTALAVFEQLINKYPDSTKQPGALLKTGYILHADGNPARARAVLEHLVQDYPASSAADMAQRRLDEIAHETP